MITFFLVCTGCLCFLCVFMMGLSANAIFCIYRACSRAEAVEAAAGLGLKEVALEKERLRAIHY